MVQLQNTTAFLHRVSRITRPQIAAQAAVYTVLGAYLAQGLSFAQVSTVVLAALTVALIVAFGFVINDYADVEIDRLTKPFRLLPAGALSSREALFIALWLALAGLVVASALPPVLFAMACGNVGLAALYSLYLKRTVLLGNVAIAVLNSSILIFGAVAAGGITSLVWAVAAMSLLYTLAQEVLYTIDDVVGDGAAGLVTTAVFFGVRPSLYLFQSLLLMAMLAALAPIWLDLAAPLYLLTLLLCTVGPALLYVVPLTWRGTPEAVSQACAVIKVVRVTSLLPLILV